MSVKKPSTNLLDTTSEAPSGKKVMSDKSFVNEVVKDYKTKNLNENKKN